MHKQKRKRIVATSFLMDEMNIDRLSVLGGNGYGELREGVYSCFSSAPIEFVPPVIDQVPHIAKIGPESPPGIVGFVRPACIGKPCL